ncbi:glutamate N-acetyltransferase [Rhodotorula paludigena]|uniref:glutamate N-acetyltransferase n=1 Tax=Rhodotorula paludigena TaxID=86838 RepID=UPI00318258EE
MSGLAKAASPLRAALAPAARLFSTTSASMASSPAPAPSAPSAQQPSAAQPSSGSPTPPAPAQPTKAQRFTLDPSSAPSPPKFPHGFLATGLHCGVKKDRSKLDLAVIISDRPCSAAGTFTRNAFVAAPVTVCKDVLASQKGVARGVVINSGCANAVTGVKGLEDARAMSDQLDSFLSASSSSNGTGTLVMSTGVIGQLLPIKKVLQGIEASTATLSSNFNAWNDCARAFMTTDTFPKLRTRTFQLAGKEVRMVGIDKGAGMIHPNMGPPGPPHATMLGVIATDAAVEPASLQSALTYAVDRSFNSISVDGDMSTNDTVLALANGASGIAEVSEDKTPDEFVRFRDELTSFAAELAQLVVRDGEGAEKFVKVTVQGAPTYEGAHKIASTVSTSSLVKTALHGEDANWGRILCAVGYSQPPFEIDPTKVSVSLLPQDGTAPLKLLVNGEPENVNEERASEILKEEDIEIQIELGLGDEQATYWTCDLSHEYISINADYRS